MAESHEITLRDVILHMQGMEQRLTKRIVGVESRMVKIEVRMNGIEGRMGGLEKRIDRMEANLLRQIEGIDQRLDSVEIEKLPKRVRRLEKLAGIV